MAGSAACTLPTWRCSRPARERMNTSKSGQSSSIAGSPQASGSGDGARGELGGMRRGGLAHPGALGMCRAARLEALVVAGPVALEYRVELAPVDRSDLVVSGGGIEAQLRIRDAEPEELRLRHGDVDELLAQLIVAEALDLPAHRLRGVPGVRIARAEHHDGRPPPAPQRILRHGALRRAAAAEREHDFEALALVETLLLADAHHGARIRPVGAAADRDLVHDRRAIDQPADGADVRPGEGRVVEDARVLGSPRQQLRDQLRTPDP